MAEQVECDVVGTDGVSPVFFNGVATDEYYIAVRHRNHLGAMTASTISLGNAVVAHDFTDNANATWGTNAQKDLGGGTMGLWSGDASGDGIVKYNGASNDKNKILALVGLFTPNNVETGYLSEDVNMDGDAKYNGANNDKNKILANVGLFTPNSVIEEQIPN